MKQSSHYSLGIDTSNYKTSVALVDADGRIICNLQKFLDVKKGERGLRQSAALFQHVNNLPQLLQSAFDEARDREHIDGVCVSARPRPVEGSYMPVFNAGISAGKMISASLDIPYFECSHQEGHIEAVKHYSPLKDTERILSFHFSGGTTEALLVDGEESKIIGGSRDLAFGQVLDRIGVAMGMDFPCGAQMDQIALDSDTISRNSLPKIKCSDGFINLSGIETKCQRMLENTETEVLIPMLFQRLGEAVTEMSRQLYIKYEVKELLYAGGVSSSRYIRQMLTDNLPDFNICFGDPALSADNAVGTALIGGKKLWL